MGHDNLTPTGEWASLVDIVSWRSQHQADRRAYTFLLDGETQETYLSYGELDRQARAIAAQLQEWEARGERVLLLYPPGLAYIAAFFGCLYAGAVAVPAYPPRLNRHDARLEAIARDSQAAFALTTGTILADLAQHIGAGLELAALRWLATDDLALEHGAAWRDPGVDRNALAFLQYTSGSTGTPKGVMVSHGNLLHNLAAIQTCYGLNANTRAVLWAPLYHDMGLIGGVLQSLYGGFLTVLMAPLAFFQQPVRWLQAISRYKATLSGGPNFAYDLCVDKITPEQRAQLDLSSWEIAYNGAEPVRATTLDRFAAGFASCGFRKQVFRNCYGLAEATLVISTMPPQAPLLVRQFAGDALEQHRVVAAHGEPTLARTIVSGGQSAPDQQIAIVHPESLAGCAPDEVGEIWVTGPSVAQGYWGHPEATRQTFRAYRADTSAGPFLRTGDLGFIRDSELFVTGRLKDVVIVRGRNHYPQDIERTVEQSHPALVPSGGAAFGVEVAGVERLVIVQEVARSYLRQLNVGELTGVVRQALAEQHDLDAHAIVLVKPGTIPKTTSGKTQRSTCRARFQEGSLAVLGEWRRPPEAAAADRPDRSAQAPAEAAGLSAAVIQSWLVARLARQLNTAPAEIDVSEPFARYGLDSLAMISLSGELETWLGRAVSPTLAYDYPSIERLARRLADGAEANQASAPTASAEPIAIVGMGCRFPGASDPASFWQLLCDGSDPIREVPADRWEVEAWYDPELAQPGKLYARYGGFLEHIDQFDPEFFGISPREAKAMDPQQRLLLEVSWEALEYAGVTPDQLRGSATGVFVGLSTADYARYSLNSNDARRIDAYSTLGNSPSVAAGRISYVLGLQGPAVQIDTACSSSLLAVHLACQSLRTGECSLALAGGVNLMIGPEPTIGLCQLQALTPDRYCKPFDAAADGYVRGEGCGVIVLKRLRDAQADGDTVLGLIRGSAANHDGRSNGLTAPNGLAQQQVIRQALANSNVAPNDLSYVEAHGTGTVLGDPIELQALADVLATHRPAHSPLLVGALKANIGHLEAAAGIAGLIKLVLSLVHQAIPPQPHFTQPNPLIPWSELAVRIPTSLTPWTTADQPRLAGVSAFGLSGTNVHVVVQEAPPVAPSALASERPIQLLTLSATSSAALRQLAQRYAQQLTGAHEPPNLADLAYSANTGRAHLPVRLALVAASIAEARTALAAAAGETVPGLRWGQILPGRAPRVAFMFTGQGAQYVGMGLDLYRSEPVFRSSLERCATLVRELGGPDLLEALYETPKSPDDLRATALAQPALFALEYALAQVWLSWGVRPTALLGHSLGEYMAACIAGVFSLHDALRLVVARSRLMQALPAGGAMAAVMASEARVRAAIAGQTQDLAIAAINGPEHVVVSGKHERVRALVEQFAAIGVASYQLHVSHAFHSPAMQPILAEFAQVAQQVSYATPTIPLVSNLHGRLATGDVATPEYWVRHVLEPVRFADGMQTLRDQGCDVFLELGPKPTLLGMGRACFVTQHQEQPEPVWLASLHPGRGDWQHMLESLSELYLRGVQVDWAGFSHNSTRRKLALPTYPFQRQRYWVDGSPTQHERAALRPLIDRMIRLPLHAETVFETNFSLEALPFLADHRLRGVVVSPAACHLAMLLNAAELIARHQAYQVEEIAFPEALALQEDTSRTVQLALAHATTNGGAGFNFQLISFDNQEQRPATHATGRVASRADPGHQVVGLEALRGRIRGTLEPGALYQAAEDREIVLGPRFRWLSAVWHGNGEALGQLRRPSVIGSVSGYVIHPGLLDGCFQLAGALGSLGTTGALMLPFTIERLRVYRPAHGDQWWCHAWRVAQQAWDIELFDTTGQLVLDIRAFSVRAAPATIGSGRPAWSEWLYSVAWQPQPQFGLRPDYMPAPQQIGERLASAQALGMSELDRYAAAQSHLDLLAIDYVLAAFARMGFAFQPGAHFDAEQLANDLDVTPRYNRLLERLLAMLAEDGYLRRGADGWVVARPAPEISPKRGPGLSAHYATVVAAELALLERCGESLADVLRGARDPLELLFPGGDDGLVARVYQDSPSAQAMNSLARQAVLAAIERLPAGRGVRILEVGAGTGSTTSYLLPNLPAAQTEYLFSDIGAAFIARAQRMFEHYPFVDYRTLDIERAPVGQGFALHQYDILIAVNVLHATKDLRATLEHVRHLLAPGGLMLLIETTTRSRWADLTFGLTDGWWRFADRDLRPDHPLLTSTQWHSLLRSCGFQSVAKAPADGGAPARAGQTLLIARADATVSAQPRQWLLFADRGGAGAALAAELRSRGEHAWLVYASSEYQQLEANAFCIAPKSAEDYRRVIEAVPAPHGVVHLWSLDAAPGAEGTELASAARHSCGSALLLAQALLRASSELPALWLVTQGAQAVTPADPVDGFAQSPLWGLGRVIRLEHPELRCMLTDLNPGEPVAAQAAAICADLLAERLSAPAEDQIAWREGVRHVARLARHSANHTEQPVAIRPDGSYLITGGLGGLGLALAGWLVDQGAGRIVLAGRGEPGPEAQRQLRELTQQGASISVVRADVADRAQVTNLLATLDPAYPLRGIVHAAGVLDDASLPQQDWDRFAKVLAPKMQGAWNLNALTSDQPLDFFVLFASAAGLLGNPGQANHAAANAFLDALAHHRRAKSQPALSIDWGAWSAVGAAAELIRSGRHSLAPGIGTIALAQGLGAFAYALNQDVSQLAVLPIDWETFDRTAPAGLMIADLRKVGAPPAIADQRNGLFEQLATLTPGERNERLTSYMRAEVARTIAHAPAEIDLQQPLVHMGFDSLMAVELRNQILREFHVNVPAASFLEDLTIERLVQLINEQLPKATQYTASLGIELAMPSSDATEAPGDAEQWMELKL